MGLDRECLSQQTTQEFRSLPGLFMQTIFIQDFLLRSSGSIARPTSLFQDFSQRFRFLFVHLKVHKALRHLISNHQNGKDIPFHPGEGFEDMAKYDWSRVRVRIVMSVPGNYSGLNQVDDFGLCRLGKVLSDEGWRPRSSEVVQAEFQVRIGSFSPT